MLKYGFTDVSYIRNVKYRKLNECPKSKCMEYGHEEGFIHCARRQCHEILNYLRPKLILHLNVFMLEDGEKGLKAITADDMPTYSQAELPSIITKKHLEYSFPIIKESLVCNGHQDFYTKDEACKQCVE